MSDQVDTERKQAEDLSAAIDRLNQGLPADDGQEREIMELIDTAKLLKAAAEPSAAPPPAVLSYIVAEAAGTITKEKNKKRLAWALGSLSSAVAAVILVILLHAMLPAVQEQEQANTLPPPQTAAEAPPPPATVQPPPDLTTTHTDTEPQVPAGPDTKFVPQPADTQQAEAIQQPIVALNPPPSPPVTEAGETMLALADRKADTVTIDAVTKTIRQVYHQAAPDEIIITQVPRQAKALRSSSELPHAQVKMAAPLAKESAGIKPPNRNKITVTVDDAEVTLEGAVSEEELRNLAKTLTKVSLSSK